MESQGVPLSEDILPTSIEGIIGALATRGCADLTSSIDLNACSDHPLAGGGFCDVYQGVLQGGSRVAIKALKVYGLQVERDVQGQRVLKRAAKELYHWSKLRHPNVLPLMGLAVFKGFISMISGWMENGDLPSYLKLKPDTDRIGLCIDICTGLRYIHKSGMVHGDLKGANVMISPDGIAMISDFGNARLQDITSSLRFSSTTSRGISYRWAAPELLLEDDIPQVSMEADVYAYGMIILEALTGKVPYEGVSERRVFSLVAYEKKVPPRPDIEISDDLWELLNRCWTWEPSLRPKITNIGNSLDAMFPPPDVPYHTIEDAIGNATTIQDIVGTFSQRTCPDLTLSINLSASNDPPLAGGWFSSVYRGSLHDGTGIAIKSLKVNENGPLEQDSRRQKLLKRAARGLYCWLKLKHRNVLPLMGLSIFRGSISMISEWMENGNLKAYLQRTPDADRGRLFMDICAGLCYIHTKGMVHGNLKCSNIMISRDGTGMIAGFGNARPQDLTLALTDAIPPGISLRWAAPEVLLDNGGPHSSMEADVYAYGMAVLEALTGEVPYGEANEKLVIQLVISEKQLPNRPILKISDGLWDLLNSCWAWEPSERPKIGEVADRLEALFPSSSLQR